ncbi:MAG: UDP-3-O-(3-hydroxymyristoyl)glucosamine N-acyltransferase [Elusimicrobia bacterium]|nr:UDP-3-O-(3-hydroxymyristoyl)glucosamine N-acyltransferase [Elusimicrobiota bacterium]
MRITLKEIASLVSGELKGQEDYLIEGVAGLESASAKDITYLGHVKYEDLLVSNKAGCVFLPAGFKSDAVRNAIYVSNPQWAFVRILRIFAKERQPKMPWGPHSTAVIHPTAKLGKNVHVGAGCVIDEGAEVGDLTVLYPQCYVGRYAKIGKNCLLYPQVVVREDCEIGEGVIVHSGTVIGSDGYGYVLIEGVHEKIPQIGKVVVEEDVEIGANVTIDRATLGETRIGRGTKIDNLVQIAHNVKIGKHCLIISQVGIAGSSQVGDYATLAGQAGIPDHIKIGNKAIVIAQSGVMADVPDGAVVFGSPARPHREAMKLQALFNKLPEIYETVKKWKNENAKV